MKAVIYTAKDGRVYWINEGHPQTDDKIAVCRVVERGLLKHTALMRRDDLTLFLITEMNNGIINMGCYPDRLNDSVEPTNTKA